MVTLGAVKKVIRGAAVTFEFRLRTIPAGQRLVWACVFPLRPGADIPAEGFLHLPHKQKFKAADFLEGKVIAVEKALVAQDEFGGRITLTDTSSVTPGKAFTDWGKFQSWDPAAALARIHGHPVGPFDLEIEMQEEVVLDDWQLGEATDERTARSFIRFKRAKFSSRPWSRRAARVRRVQDPGRLTEEETATAAVCSAALRRCRLVLQPLSVFGSDGPEYLTISDEKLDRAALLKALKLV